MAMTLQLQTPSAATLPLGTLSIGPISFAGTIAPLLSNVNLGSGANTVTVPSGAVGMVITPPVTNTVALTLKGVSGDTGLSMSASAPTVYFFGTAPANVVITAASATTGYTEILFF